MSRPIRPLPPPVKAGPPTPNHLLNLAAAVLHNDEPVLDGRRSVTAAALARQAIESSIDRWFEAKGMPNRATRREDFACLAALHPDQTLTHQLHNAWARLSSACHATSYDLPPNPDELERWMTVARLFISKVD